MSRRAGRRWLVVLSCWLSVAPGACTAAEPGRDWKSQPAIVEMDTPHDLYAVGDVHGDYDRLVNLLVVGKVIAADPPRPGKVRWRAGRAVLVCTGDLIDKGKHALRVIALFRALQADAARAGGRVIVTLGNHEARFLAHAGRDKRSQDFVKELTRHGLDPTAVAAGRDAQGVGAFLRGLPFAARVNDWFFAHAGNTHGRSLAQLRADLQAGVDRAGFKAPVLLDPDSLLEARMSGKAGPWWQRKGDSPGAGRARLARYVKALGVAHLVVGHQPSNVTFADAEPRRAGKLVQRFDGLIFLIDVGMSREIGHSTGALLHVRRTRTGRREAVVVTAKGVKRIWPAAATSRRRASSAPR
jgi:hypothetical protein